MDSEPNKQAPESGDWKVIIIFLVFLFFLFAIAPYAFRSRKKADQTVATSNARQIGLALFEFNRLYGSYPSASLVPHVAEGHPTHGYELSGPSSNSLFRQLIAADVTQSEAIFYAKINGVGKPDGNITPGEALKNGEVAFAYISGLSAKDEPKTPIVLTPLIPGTTKFDPIPFKGFAVVLHIDNSVRTYNIAKDGHIYDDNGLNLLSPTHPIWNGKPPTIHYPE